MSHQTTKNCTSQKKIDVGILALIKVLALDGKLKSKFAVFVCVPLGFSATLRELSVIFFGFPANLQVVASCQLFLL